MAFDAAEIAREVQKQAVRHEKLHERLSGMVGPVADYQTMTTAELAKYGLEKMGVEPPDADEDPCVVALENFLHGRAGRAMGASAGMDSAGAAFVDRYIQGSANRSMDGDADAGESSLDRYINSPREDV
jgi:hypothetical protein